MFPMLKSYLIYFLTGGIFTVLIVALEEGNFRLASGFATLIPVFTLVAYFFIGESRGGALPEVRPLWRANSSFCRRPRETWTDSTGRLRAACNPRSGATLRRVVAMCGARQQPLERDKLRRDRDRP